MKLSTIIKHVVPPTWAISCIVGGMHLLEWLILVEPRWTLILMPLVFIVWIGTMFLGHHIIGKVYKYFYGN